MVDSTDPGAGDPYAIRQAAVDREDKARVLRDVLTTAKAELALSDGDAWTGSSRLVFERHIEAALPELELLQSSLDAVASTLRVYADEIDAIQDEQQTLERHLSRLQNDRDELYESWKWSAEFGELFESEEYAEKAELLAGELRTAESDLTAAEADWDALVKRRQRADEDCIAALQSRDVRGNFAGLPDSGAATTDQVLEVLSRLTGADMRLLLASNPDLLDRLHKASPDDVAEWWAGMSPPETDERSPQQELLIENLPAFIGALGGLPAAARVAANRIVAIQRLAALRQQIDKLHSDGPPAYPTTTYGAEYEVTPAGEATWQAKIDELQLELDYLERVESGDVQLYLFDPEREHIIEMFGDPDTAKSTLSFMPGTNTTMESFYRTDEHRITALAEWQVANARGGAGSVAAFVVKQGAFPQLGGNVIATGPQNNDMAESLGRSYHGFARELGVITGGAPVVSVEHSFGSAVGGEAETRGAGFHTRVSLAGIGMGWGWEADPDTEHIALQAPNDINRHLDGAQAWNWGYAHKPDASSGFTEVHSGIGGTPAWVPVAAPISLPVALAGEIASGVEHHNQIISGDPGRNETVLTQLQVVMGNAGRGAG